MEISLPQIGTANQNLSHNGSSGAGPVHFSWVFAARMFFFCAVRLAFGSFLLLTSVYCVLVWVPFSYFSFIHNPPFAWIPLLVRLHAPIYAVLLVAIAITLVPELRAKNPAGKSTRTAAAGFLIINACACLCLLFWHGLGDLQPDISSYSWSLLSLFPLLWLAAFDLSGIIEGTLLDRLPRTGFTDSTKSDLTKTTLAALIVFFAFAGTSALRAVMQGADARASLPLPGIAASFCFHLTILVAIGIILAGIGWATNLTSRPALLNFLFTRLLAAILLYRVLRVMILPTISFEGIPADIFAAVAALVMVIFASGVAARVRAERRAQGLADFQAPTWSWGFAIVAVLIAAYAIPEVLGRTDWDFVLQRLAVMAVWLAAVQWMSWAGIGRGTENDKHSKARWSLSGLIALVFAVCGLAGFAVFARSTLYSRNPAPTLQGDLDAYAGSDISFKTAYSVLSRPVDNQAYRQFYEFLKQHTNLTRNDSAGPVDVSLVPDLRATPGPKPNVFLFVIDSLRRDYVGPYNSAVDFTPHIDQFAKDSVVMQNAFTRYGGTALSEPAIWVGAMQLHKQYIEPFYPMNNLQKLLDAEGYQSYVSVDVILKVMMNPGSSLTELDKDCKSWDDLDFVPTLKELEAKIDARTDRQKPIFAYTQPQNVHTLTLERSKIKGGRKAVSMYELRRMDAAFAEFVDFLRQRGLYDNSIIILTADHGDSYGEFGRWGHSDFLFPEVIRIPLIVHLPEAMREHFVWDAKQPAFTTDITPSLYYLLGHPAVVNNELFGRPLFTRTLEEQQKYKRTHYLVVSSYAPVYAILGDEAQSLFIVDAVNSKNYFFNLNDDPLGTRNHVTPPLENENEALIRHDVGLIDDLYRWHPPAETP